MQFMSIAMKLEHSGSHSPSMLYFSSLRISSEETMCPDSCSKGCCSPMSMFTTFLEQNPSTAHSTYTPSEKVSLIRFPGNQRLL